MRWRGICTSIYWMYRLYQRGHKKARRTTIVSIAFVLMAIPSAASTIELAGVTNGCFGINCSDFSAAAFDPNLHLTFTGVGSDAIFKVFSDTSEIELGTLYRDARFNVPDSASSEFVLDVIFGNPSADVVHLRAFVAGTTHGGGGPLSVDFDNTPQWIVYTNASGHGGFYLTVTSDLDVTKNGTATIFGRISGGTFTPSEESTSTVIAGAPVDPLITPVPEPTSLVLLGSGLLAIASRLRQCQRKSISRKSK